MLLSSTRKDWLGNVRGDVLAGIVVALALIPEAIAFSIIAGVDPQVGLYSAFCIPMVMAVFGGRPAMISSATGAMALLMITLVKDHGLQYLLAASVLTGVFQLLAGYLKLGNLMRYVSRSVVTGFVNALAILIFMAQLPELTNVTWHVYALTAAGLAIIYLFPYINKTLPSPLVCIVVLTVISMWLHLDVRTVGDMGKLPDSLPVFLIPAIPLDPDTLMIILPYSAGLAVVGLLESMMTATIVDDMTNTPSDKNRECKAQGIANICTAFIGGMAGCAMIGQSVINVKSGGRGRLSALAAGAVLLCLIIFLRQWVAQIPMAALVAVMVMVAIGTFAWRSITDRRRHPLSTSAVMLATVAVVVVTHNLAFGVLTGVLIASLNFATKVARFMTVTSDLNQGVRTYTARGQVFFASADRFMNHFDFREALERVVIDVTQAHFWDITAVNALDKTVLKFRREGVKVEIRGMNDATCILVERFGIHNRPGGAEKMMKGH